MTPPQILISAGEASGEMYAARLSKALRARTGAHLFGLGGPCMREAGVELVADSSEVAVVGISEVLRKIPALRRTMRRLVEEAARRKPVLAILTDFPGFHLRLARRLSWQGVRNVYFICPQFWAWRPWRVRLVQKRFERALCIFPFEEEFYRRAGMSVNFIGHPLVDDVLVRNAPQERAEDFVRKYSLGFDAERPIVALLPGSRPSEISQNWPEMLAACRALHPRCFFQYVVALAPGIAAAQLAGYPPRDLPMRAVEGATYEALAAASVAIISSGTATVEASLIGTPMVVVYRVSGTTAFLARRLVRTPFFAMPNLIAGRRVVPELFQEEFIAERVAEEGGRLLESADAREAMKRDLAEVRFKLGSGGAIERAADIIAGML